MARLHGAWLASMAAVLTMQGAAWAQSNGSPRGDVQSGSGGATTTNMGFGHGQPPDPNANAPRFGRLNESSIGLRVWAVSVPAWEVGLFSSVRPGWSGPLGVAIGPEYVSRSRNLDFVVSLFYVDLSTHSTPAEPGSGLPGDNIGYIHGSNEGETDTEAVWSQLYGVFFSVTALGKAQITDWLEFQYGAGIGLGYIGGDLHREQAYQTSSGDFARCSGPFNPPTTFCGTNNNHYSNYVEPDWIAGGSRPTIMPWLDLPALALHIRPAKNFDIRLDFGWAIWNFHGGLALHYVWF